DLARRSRETAGERIDQPWCREDPENREADQHDREQRGHATDQLPRRVVTATSLILGKDRHERLRERTFREEPPQYVWQAKGRLERVHLQTRAECHGLQALASEPRDTRQKRERADGGERLEQIHR